MRIWWCQEHEAAGKEPGCPFAWIGIGEGNAAPCRMVPMRLIPDDFNEYVKRMDDAEWSALAEYIKGLVKRAASALDGETP